MAVQSSRVPLGLALVVGLTWAVAVEPAGLVQESLLLLLLGGEPGEEAAREKEADELEDGHGNGGDSDDEHALLDGLGDLLLAVGSELIENGALHWVVLRGGHGAVGQGIVAAALEGLLNGFNGVRVRVVELGPALVGEVGDVVPHDVGGDAECDLDEDEDEHEDRVDDEEGAVLPGGTEAPKERHDKDEAAKGDDTSRDGNRGDASDLVGHGIGTKSNQNTASDLMEPEVEQIFRFIGSQREIFLIFN